MGGCMSKDSAKQSKEVAMRTMIVDDLTGNVEDDYLIGRILGQGQFGVTTLAKRKDNNKRCACKTISKLKLVTEADIQDIKREVHILRHLSGTNNVVQFYGVYEDIRNVHIVMELCEGGELYDSIIEAGHYSEKKAAKNLQTMLMVVKNMHDLGVVHRDLKPENFLLSSKSGDAELKATDFGLSAFFKDGERFSEVIGSAYYIAPEVLLNNYGHEIDVWSIGVIMYILLCGWPPFNGETEKEIFNNILKAPIDFVSDPWPAISEGAKDCVNKMLVRDPAKRATCTEILSHPWMNESAPDTPLDNAVAKRIKQFAAMNKLKKAALKIMAASLTASEVEGLKKMFATMDKDGSGCITFEELRKGLKQQGFSGAENEIMDMMEKMDLDGNGTVDWDEFIAATVNVQMLNQSEALLKAFQTIDKDNSGFITEDEIEKCLKDYGFDHEATEIVQIIKECDENSDGKISYEEFAHMMNMGRKPEETAQQPNMTKRNSISKQIV